MKTGILLAAAIAISVQAAPAGQDADAALQRRRGQIQILEGVLTRAVRSGAEGLARRMQSRNPNVMLFTGQARARGFILDGYGVFFDVEIPALRESVVWSMLALERDVTITNAIESLRRALAGMPDSPTRLQAEQALKQVQQLGPAAQVPRALGSPKPGSVTAATVDGFDDPHTAYTDAVKTALIEAMLDYSLPMDLGADEWLTVAARDSEGPMTPDEIYDASTIVIRVKGSDLATYAADRTKRDEVRSRVQVRVF